MTCLLARSMRITSTMPPVRLNRQEATVPNQMVLHFPELSEHVEIWNVESGIALNLLNLV